MSDESKSYKIVIPCYEDHEELDNLLESLMAVGVRGKDVCVALSGPERDIEFLQKKYEFKLVISDFRLNPAQTRNLGARSTKGNYLAFLDADTLVAGSWVEALSETAAEHSIRLIGDTCHISKNPGWIEKNWFASLNKMKRRYLNGANIIVRRDFFEKIGGFDESLDTGEDFDFCLRAEKAGVIPKLDERFFVFHEGYPKTIWQFIKRECWHATGDLSSAKAFFSSSVMMASSFYFILLVAIFVAAVSSEVSNLLFFSFLTFIYVLSITIYKFGWSFYSLPSNFLIMNFYLAGRAMALVNKLLKPLKPESK